MSLLQNSNAISAGGYEINNSLRFRASATAYLSRTPTVAGNRRTYTLSMWVKRGLFNSAGQDLFRTPNTNPSTGIRFTGTSVTDSTNDCIRFFFNNGTSGDIQTTQVFRDPSAWYHLVAAVDTTQATAANRVKLYVNGQQITALTTATYPSQNYDTDINAVALHLIGGWNSQEWLDGYLADYYFIDGQALTPSSFGQTDPVTGVWQAKKYTGTYGTNGFYLPFSNTETNENLLTYSEQFDNAAWVKNNVTVTANTVASPLNTSVVADTLYESATNAEHFLEYTVSNPTTATEHTFSCYAKYINRRYIRLRTVYQGGPSDISAIFDLTSGVVVSNAALYASITSVGSGWYRLSMTTKTLNPNPVSQWLHRIHAENDTYSGVYTGDVTKGYYIFGAQVNYGIAPKQYITTTSSTVTPRGTTENALTYSEDATNAAWNKVAITATANTTTAPNGTSTADSILETATTGLHVLLPTSSLTLALSNVHTASLYVKPINNQFIQLVLDDTATTNGGYANYDIVNGTVTYSSNYGAGLGIGTSITSVGSGWYRISLSTSIGNGTVARFAINGIQSGSSGIFPSYAGNTSNGYYVWGMQVEESPTVGPYLPTTSSAQSKIFRIGSDKSLGSIGYGYNSWTSNNISLTNGTTYDAMIDSPTNASVSGTQPVGNYAVLSPIDWISANGTITSANLNWASSANSCGNRATIGATSGKWYWEAVGSSVTSGTVGGRFAFTGSDTTAVEQDKFGMYWHPTSGIARIVNGTNTYVTSAYTYTNSDVLALALDLDNNISYWYKNGTLQYTYDFSAYSTIGARVFFPYVWNASSGTPSWVYNFGQRPFAYTPPSGFKSICTTNLPDSTIVQGNKYMDATLYTGNNTTNNIVNAGAFKPDLVWVKSRSATYSNTLINSVMGLGSALFSDTTGAVTATSEYTSFNSNGFSLTTSGSTASNVNAATYVAWQWQAGQGTTSSNTSGSITSTVSVNTTAGFSIVTYTTQASGTGTVGHGLGVAPKMIITKTRGVTAAWVTYHASIGNTQYVSLNATTAATTDSTIWNNTSPTSTVFTLGTGYAGSFTEVAYCFAEIAGFSKFGSYTGNGSTDGPFIYTGFRPKYIMRKCSSNPGYGCRWEVLDTARSPYNQANANLSPNYSNAEDSTAAYWGTDILSNGFKLRNTDTEDNVSGQTYIYMAFAENPFKNALAR